MNDDRTIRLLEEIRDLQRRLVDTYQQVLRNQQDAIARTRRLQVALGVVIGVVFVVVLVLLNYVMRRYA